MELIKHRANTVADLMNLPTSWGAEVDIRSQILPTKSLHLAHDPWQQGESFDTWLQAVKRQGLSGPLILNTKEDGLEEACLRSMASAGIHHFWFLDTALPTLIKWCTTRGERRFAVRYSSYEPSTLAQQFRGLVDWVWVDCFAGVTPDVREVEALSKHFKICLVSPELQVGLDDQIADRIAGFSHLAGLASAVCSKRPELWVK